MIRRSSAKKPKAAIYVRVSTEEQAKEGYSLSAQETALKEYAGMMGYDVFKVYRDEGKSAKDITHRPALQQLLKDADRKLFKAICVYKLDRFSRSLKDLILTIEMLKKQEIDFISLQDKIETASASGKLMFHIISSFAEFERDIISERTRFGMTEKAREGGIISKAPLGYKIHEGKFLIDEEKAREVREIFKEYTETDKSLNSIAREYKLTVAGLIKVLKNRAYIGEIKFKEHYAGTHEIVVDKELFAKAQEKLDKNSHNRETLRYRNLLQRLNPGLETQFLDKLTSSLVMKEIVLEKKNKSDYTIETPTETELADIPGSNKVQKQIATQILLEEGYDEEEITYDRVFVNADKTDIYASTEGRNIYVDCTPENLQKLLEYLHEGIEYWLIQMETEKPEEMKCYQFRKSES